MSNSDLLETGHPRTDPVKISLESLTPPVNSKMWKLGLLHRQNGVLLLWLTRGHCVVNLHGYRRGVGVHQIIYVPHGHLWSIAFGRGALALALTIEQHAANGCFPSRCQILRIFEPHSHCELTELVDSVRRENFDNRYLKSEALAVQAKLLSLWLCREAMQQRDNKICSNPNRNVDRFFNLVCEKVGHGLNLSDFAEILGVTTTHLTRVCKASCSMTASEVLAQCLLHKARTDLEENSKTIREISTTLGFSSPAYFNRFISRHFGVAPSELRG